MINRSDVEMAYRLILGREPGSEQAVEGHMTSAASLDDLRKAFMGSQEFRDKLALMGMLPSGKPLNWPPTHIDTQVSEPQLRAMIARVERNFRHMGETEPHWSVLSAERFRSANIGNNRDEFFSSGAGVVKDFLAAAERCGARSSAAGACFELGCGLGRSTIWLAQHFSHVIAADVSAPHIELARQIMVEFSRPNVTLLQVDQIAKLRDLPTFDTFFSIIVLQHNPPPLIRHLLDTIFLKLKRDGLAYFQMPTYGLNYSFKIEEYLAKDVRLGVPEMHALPQQVVYELATARGCRVLEVREDAASGARFVSNRFLIQKVDSQC